MKITKTQITSLIKETISDVLKENSQEYDDEFVRWITKAQPGIHRNDITYDIAYEAWLAGKMSMKKIRGGQISGQERKIGNVPIYEVIREADELKINDIRSKLRATQDDVRGVNVSETKYFTSGEEPWIKKYEKGFGMFLVLPKSKNVAYYSASIIPLNENMNKFDVSIHYEKAEGFGKKDLEFKNLDITSVVKTLKFYKN